MEKIRLHSYTYGCFLVSRAKVVQFLSIKTPIPCIFYSCLTFIWKKGRGNFWRPQFALWQPKIYTWSPVGAPIKKLISDPENAIPDRRLNILTREKCILCGEIIISLPSVTYMYHFLIFKIWQNNVLFTLNCLLGKFEECFNVGNNLWRSMVCGDLWWM